MAKEVALWARTRATTLRLDAKSALATASAMNHSPALVRARERYATALVFCAEIMDETADEIEAAR